jgi:glycosyltransferase involved in cell wall biosynthesis
MKILLASREFPPDGLYWGAASYYQNLAHALAARGHGVHVVCQAWNGMRERHDGDILVHEVGSRPVRGSALGRVDFSIHAVRTIRRLIKKHQIDVVDAPLFLGEPFLLALFKGSVPLITQCHAWTGMLLDTKSYRGLAEHGLLSVTALLEKATARRADRVIANSKLTYDWLVRHTGVSDRKLCLVPHGIDTDLFSPKTAGRLNIDLPVGGPRCLFVGRFQARKGLHVLIEAIPMILQSSPTAKFILIGRDTDTAPDGGSVIAFLKEKAQRGGFADSLIINETFLSDQEVARLYLACDLFVFPTLSETFGLPVLEAMACERPVVTTATGVSAELPAVNEALQVVPAGDVTAFAKAVTKVLGLPKAHRKELAMQLRGMVLERFTAHQMFDRILAVYEEALEEHRLEKRIESRMRH